MTPMQHCDWRCVLMAGYVALFALMVGIPFSLTWPRQSKWIKVRMWGQSRILQNDCCLTGDVTSLPSGSV